MMNKKNARNTYPLRPLRRWRPHPRPRRQPPAVTRDGLLPFYLSMYFQPSLIVLYRAAHLLNKSFSLGLGHFACDSRFKIKNENDVRGVLPSNETRGGHWPLLDLVVRDQRENKHIKMIGMIGNILPKQTRIV